MTKFYKDCVQLYNSLASLDGTKPILVIYNDVMKCLEFRSEGKTSIVYFLSPYFVHKKFNYGALLPEDYIELMDQLQQMTADTNVIEDKYVISASVNQTNIYHFHIKNNPPNKVKYELKYISITDKDNFILIRLLLWKSPYYKQLRNTLINEKTK